MFLINNINNNPLQTMNLILPNGFPMAMSIYFMPQQYGWIITTMTYHNITINGVRICNSPNLLSQFINQLPFGLACYSTQNREPSQQNDFISQASLLYLLSASECEEVQNIYQTGTVV